MMTAAATAVLLPVLTLVGASEPAPPFTRQASTGSDAGGYAGGHGGSAPSSGTWPLSPRPEVVTGFDPPVTTWSAGHRGVDLLGSPGQPVRAALAGTVVFAGRIGGKGVVVVGHGATRTTYEPVVATLRAGAAVTAGGVLGTLESSAASHCWPRTCLHWGLLRGDTYLDPLTLVGAGPVRLLPLGPPLPPSVPPGATPLPVVGMGLPTRTGVDG